MDDKIDESNVRLYAARFYENPNCFDTVEFYDDLKRLSYIKRLFNKYNESGDIKVRLVINHLIVLYNVFGEFATKMLFLKLVDYLDVLIPFLLFINRCPTHVSNIGIEGKTIHTSNINMNNEVIELLRAKYGKFQKFN
ncbi:MAG TPA: hypothetical protein DCX27_19195 [Balneola sp.]|nr:hypothetical protein [Balneola sp.]